MLLSRLAESVYWTGRYLERAEATARILATHTELFLDLPRSAGVTFAPLLAVAGSGDHFAEVHDEPTEEAVVSWLAGDRANPASIVASLAAARENVRTTRQLFPRETWEIVNHTYLCAVEDADHVVGRRTRLAWLDDVLGDLQRLTGLMAGSMHQDETYSFLRVGRHLERADMTTRVLDVRAATLMGARDEALRAFVDVQWMGVLRCLGAHQAYRRRVQARVSGPEALRFLLQDPQFPRSVEHCLTQIAQSLLELPRHDDAMAVCARSQQLIEEARVRTLAWDGLHEFVDELQVHLGDLNDVTTTTWFRGTVTAPPPLLASA